MFMLNTVSYGCPWGRLEIPPRHGEEHDTSQQSCSAEHPSPAPLSGKHERQSRQEQQRRLLAHDAEHREYQTQYGRSLSLPGEQEGRAEGEEGHREFLDPADPVKRKKGDGRCEKENGRDEGRDFPEGEFPREPVHEPGIERMKDEQDCVIGQGPGSEQLPRRQEVEPHRKEPPQPEGIAVEPRSPEQEPHVVEAEEHPQRRPVYDRRQRNYQ